MSKNNHSLSLLGGFIGLALVIGMTVLLAVSLGLYLQFRESKPDGATGLAVATVIPTPVPTNQPASQPGRIDEEAASVGIAGAVATSPTAETGPAETLLVGSVLMTFWGGYRLKTLLTI